MTQLVFSPFLAKNTCCSICSNMTWTKTPKSCSTPFAWPDGASKNIMTCTLCFHLFYDLNHNVCTKYVRTCLIVCFLPVCLSDHLHLGGRLPGGAPSHLPLPAHHGRLHPRPQHPHRSQRLQDLSCGQGTIFFLTEPRCPWGPVNTLSLVCLVNMH